MRALKILILFHLSQIAKVSTLQDAPNNTRTVSTSGNWKLETNSTNATSTPITSSTFANSIITESNTNAGITPTTTVGTMITPNMTTGTFTINATVATLTQNITEGTVAEGTSEGSPLSTTTSEDQSTTRATTGTTSSPNMSEDPSTQSATTGQSQSPNPTEDSSTPSVTAGTPSSLSPIDDPSTPSTTAGTSSSQNMTEDLSTPSTTTWPQSSPNTTEDSSTPSTAAETPQSPSTTEDPFTPSTTAGTLIPQSTTTGTKLTSGTNVESTTESPIMSTTSKGTTTTESEATIEVGITSATAAAYSSTTQLSTTTSEVETTTTGITTTTPKVNTSTTGITTTTTTDVPMTTTGVTTTTPTVNTSTTGITTTTTDVHMTTTGITTTTEVNTITTGMTTTEVNTTTTGITTTPPEVNTTTTTITVSTSPSTNAPVSTEKTTIGNTYWTSLTPLTTTVKTPDFVAKNVTTTTRQNTANIACYFDESVEDLFYSVTWSITQVNLINLTKEFCNKSNLTLLDLTAKDLVNKNINMGFMVSCSVRAYYIPGGHPGKQSDQSTAFFAGIRVMNQSNITMHRGETKSIDIELTVPFRCDIPGCSLILHSYTQDYGSCERNSLGFVSSVCGLTIKQDDVSLVHTLNITSSETGQYGLAGQFNVFLQTGSFGSNTVWNDIKLSPIHVEILPESEKTWRGKMCAARNDPHMYTFDGRQYEHHERGSQEQDKSKGTFTLYKNIKYGNDVEVQHRVTPCTTPNNPAMCNCGVAVRAGRDVYVISVCDNNIDIGYKRCGDNILTMKKADDMTYTIYLPYGTAVHARIDIQPWMGPEGGMALDISINPSVYDQEGNSRGLCGTLDGDPSNDFHFTDANGLVNIMENRIEFINQWKVQEEKSMFSQNVEMKLNPWLFPICVCYHDRTLIQDCIPCKSSIESCTPGVASGIHNCHDQSTGRTTRSLRYKPSNKKGFTPHYFIGKSRIKRETDVIPWTNTTTATDYCDKFLKERETYRLCQKVPSTHTGISLDNCVLDIMLSNSTEWSKLTLQSMQDSCISTVMKNTTVRAETTNVTSNDSGESVADFEIIQDIIQKVAISCLHDCNDNGNCKHGTCKCTEGFGGTDCSVNTTNPPHLAGLFNAGLCDVMNSTCDNIYGYGYIFLDANLTCRLKQGSIDRTGSELHIRTATLNGQAVSLTEVSCPLDVERRKRSVSDENPAFVTMFDISVSNTGDFSDELRGYIVDSTCQESSKSSESDFTFSLKTGTCYIDGQCYKDRESHPDDYSRVCVPEIADDKWTTTSTTTTNVDISNTRKTTLELLLDYRLPSTDDLSNTSVQNNYIAEAQKVLTEVYEKMFGAIALVKISNINVSRSLLIAHTIYTNKFADEALFKLIENGIHVYVQNVTVFGIVTKIHELRLVQDQRCTIYGTIHECDCELVDGSPKCKVLEQTHDNSVLTIWVPVTSGLALILLIILAVFLYKRRIRGRKQAGEGDNSSYNDMMPQWVERSASIDRQIYTESAPVSQSDVTDVISGGSLLPRLTRNGNYITATPDYFQLYNK